jgi:hypothetical protein
VRRESGRGEGGGLDGGAHRDSMQTESEGAAGDELGSQLGSQVRRHSSVGYGGTGVSARLGHAQGSSPPLYRGAEHQSPRRARTPRLAAAALAVGRGLPWPMGLGEPGGWASAGVAGRSGSGLRARPVPVR